jgi:hypothetical protein
MKINISEILKHNIPIDKKIDLINKLNRPNFGEINDILNFEYYFSKHFIEWDIHGPELENNKVYLSIFHFMEYNGINPLKYDTISIGGYLSTITQDFKICKYISQSYDVNKYDFEFRSQNKSCFENYKV